MLKNNLNQLLTWKLKSKDLERAIYTKTKPIEDFHDLISSNSILYDDKQKCSPHMLHNKTQHRNIHYRGYLPYICNRFSLPRNDFFIKKRRNKPLLSPCFRIYVNFSALTVYKRLFFFKHLALKNIFKEADLCRNRTHRRFSWLNMKTIALYLTACKNAPRPCFIIRHNVCVWSVA